MNGEQSTRADVLRLIGSLRLLLDKARKDVDEYENALTMLYKLSKRLESDLQTTTVNRPARVASPVSTTPLARGKTHRDTIVSIFRNAGAPLRVTDIAGIADEKHLITSSRGYRGTYSIITTVLTRNSKHVFAHLKDGLWDLRDRHVLAAPSNGNSHGMSADESVSFSPTWGRPVDADEN